MKIHHLACGCMCPLGGHLMDGVTPGVGPACLVCHCLLLETEAGLVLCDTGFGVQDMSEPNRRLADFFHYLNRPLRDEKMTALRQIEAMGFSAHDVRHIVLTHLDFDHAGGLSDFPDAQVHLLAAEAQHARHPRGFIDRRRFRPEQWISSGPWRTYAAGGEPWFGFDAVNQLDGLPPEILLIPLLGHTFGHAGIAVHGDRGWLLHAGDAFFNHREMATPHSCPLGADLYQRMMEVDRGARLRNQARLRQLVASQPIDVFCSHDPAQFERLRPKPAHA